MPEGEVREPGREPAVDSSGSEDHAQRLRRVSDSILAEIDAIRQLELEARRLPVGSPEFKRVSAEIAARTRAMFRLSGEQEGLADQVEEQDRAIKDVDPDR